MAEDIVAGLLDTTNFASAELGMGMWVLCHQEYNGVHKGIEV